MVTSPVEADGMKAPTVKRRSRVRRLLGGIWRFGSVVVPTVAGALGISLEPEAIANVAVGGVLKRVKKVPNWAIPAINVAVGAGIALGQGQPLEQAIATGAVRAVIATGAHSAVKNPVKQLTGRNI